MNTKRIDKKEKCFHYSDHVCIDEECHGCPDSIFIDEEPNDSLWKLIKRRVKELKELWKRYD